MKITELNIKEPYCSIFRIDGDVLNAIQENMTVSGYDQSQPIIIWQGRNIVIDGHTRVQAAKNLGFEEIPVHENQFKDEDAALEYAISKQRDRRNLNDSHILDLVAKLDDIIPRGGDRRSNFGNQKIEITTEGENAIAKERTDSRERTAELIGVSIDKVSQCRHIIKNCTKEEIAKIISGNKTMHQVYKSSISAKKKEKTKQKEQDRRLEIVKKLKTKDLPFTNGKGELKKLGKRTAMLDNLVLKLLPGLYERTQEMGELRKSIDFFKAEDKDVFNIFCNELPVQEFLGHSFVSEFISILQSLGYRIENLEKFNKDKPKRGLKELSLQNRQRGPNHNIEIIKKTAGTDEAAPERVEQDSSSWSQQSLDLEKH